MRILKNMSTNSIPDISNELDIAKIRNPKSIVPSIYLRLKDYINSNAADRNNYDNQEKLHSLKYTVVRLYAHNLLNTLKNSNFSNKYNTTFMQLKTILNSKIINNIEYPLSIRIGKFFVLLNQICEIEIEIDKTVREWDSNVIYF